MRAGLCRVYRSAEEVGTEQREGGFVLPGPDLALGRFDSCKRMLLYISWSLGKIRPRTKAATGSDWQHPE